MSETLDEMKEKFWRRWESPDAIKSVMFAYLNKIIETAKTEAIKEHDEREKAKREEDEKSH
jgi:hypothetical protein